MADSVCSSANKFLGVKFGLRTYFHELINYSLLSFIQEDFEQIDVGFLISKNKMNLYKNLVRKMYSYLFMVCCSQHFQTLSSTNNIVNDFIKVTEEKILMQKRSAYQPTAEISAMKFKKTKANLEEAKIITTSEYLR